MLRGLLAAGGIKSEVHDDHLPDNAPDEQWMELASKRNWTVITGRQ